LLKLLLSQSLVRLLRGVSLALGLTLEPCLLLYLSTLCLVIGPPLSLVLVLCFSQGL
jgi:hypothetical protein